MALATTALEWLSERTRVTSTEWALGIEALVRALLSEDEAAESLYREAIERLGGTRVRAQLACAHLLYASGCAASTAVLTHVSSCAPRTACWTRWASRRSRPGPPRAAGHG